MTWWWHLAVGLFGLALVLAALADLVNTLVTTHTSKASFWLTARLYRVAWRTIRSIAEPMRNGSRRDALLSTFAPVSVLALLMCWVTQQVVGWGLVWWAVGGLKGGGGLWNSIYFSGVVYFTVGFGEIVPNHVIPRIGALFEAFFGVLTTALVIGYLPSLFSAYAERERKLMLLDDGTEQRITPTNLILARAPGGNVADLDDFFREWEDWTAGVLATHTSFPMLKLFRSQQPTQHWITAIGLVCDAAAQAQMIRTEGGSNASRWMLRRGIRLFEELTEGVDLRAYDEDFRVRFAEPSDLFRDLHAQLTEGGFDVLPAEEAFRSTVGLRASYVPRMEFLIDDLLAPRGFWPHKAGVPMLFPGQRVLNE